MKSKAERINKQWIFRLQYAFLKVFFSLYIINYWFIRLDFYTTREVFHSSPHGVVRIQRAFHGDHHLTLLAPIEFSGLWNRHITLGGVAAFSLVLCGTARKDPQELIEQFLRTAFGKNIIGHESSKVFGIEKRETVIKRQGID